MKDLFLTENKNEIFSRIDRLNSDTQRQWGKMDVAQMLAHCCFPLEHAVGTLKSQPTGFVKRLLGKMVKGMATTPKPFKRDLPTDPTFVVATPQDFEAQKGRLKNAITNFVNAGGAKVSEFPHPFFGKLTGAEWSNLMYKHLDHHLSQFGV